MENAPARNGLQALRTLGIPDSAITALLLALATLTLIPYVAGREFGPYTVPDLLPSSTYWPLVLGTPIIWAALLLARREPERMDWRRTLMILGGIETIVLPIAIFCSPVIEHRQFVADIAAEKSAKFAVQLPFAQQIEVSIDRLERLPAGSGVWVTICGASSTNCDGDQYSEGSVIYRRLSKGRAAVDVFNFKDAVAPVKAAVTVTYVRRRFV